MKETASGPQQGQNDAGVIAMDWHCIRYLPDLYIVMTPEFVIIEASDAYLKATQSTRETLIGNKIFDIFSGSQSTEAAISIKNIRASFMRVIKSRIPEKMPLQYYSIPVQDGEKIHIENRCWSIFNSFIPDENNRIKYLYQRVEDVTVIETMKQREQEQQLAIKKLSIPVLQLQDRLLLLPLIGVIDRQRSEQIVYELLHSITRTRTKVVILDITGVASVDAETVNGLMHAIDVMHLMGVKIIMTGFSTSVAKTFIALNINVKKLKTSSSLESGMEEARRIMH